VRAGIFSKDSAPKSSNGLLLTSPFPFFLALIARATDAPLVATSLVLAGAFAGPEALLPPPSTPAPQPLEAVNSFTPGRGGEYGGDGKFEFVG